jgi:hypothetical protein
MHMSRLGCVRKENCKWELGSRHSRVQDKCRCKSREGVWVFKKFLHTLTFILVARQLINHIIVISLHVDITLIIALPLGKNDRCRCMQRRWRG